MFVEFRNVSFDFPPELFVNKIEQKFQIAIAGKIATILSYMGIHCFPICSHHRNFAKIVFKTFLGKGAEVFRCV